MLTTIDTDTTQLFVGATLTQDDNCECTSCNRTLREGEQVTIYAARQEDTPTFRIERIYCRECIPEKLTSPTLGLSEYLLGGRIARTLDVQTQNQFQTLHEPQTLATSAPSEGTAEAHNEHDEHADPSVLILASKTQEQEQELTDAIYHIERTDDTDTEENPTPLCNCSLDEEYTRISLAEAEASAARCCQNCRTAREGGQDTRLCLYCEEPIAMSRWPQHVRTCTSDPTDATETDPDGDPMITDSATAIHGPATPATHRSVPVGAEGSESTQE